MPAMLVSVTSNVERDPDVRCAASGEHHRVTAGPDVAQMHDVDAGATLLGQVHAPGQLVAESLGLAKGEGLARDVVVFVAVEVLGLW